MFIPTEKMLFCLCVVIISFREERNEEVTFGFDVILDTQFP